MGGSTRAVSPPGRGRQRRHRQARSRTAQDTDKTA